MDFHSIISAAKQNVSESEYRNGKYYKTKFDAPKKTTKEKKLSHGIRKFLEKQKQDEEEKIRRDRERKLELLSRRDPKEQRKIEKTLKVIKSSKKFYTGDKKLDENTEVTLQDTIGDNDDYEFESKFSETLYEKLMEKYNKMPQDDKFASTNGNKKSKSTAQETQESTDGEIHIKHGAKQRVSKIKTEGISQPSVSKKSQTTVPNTPKLSSSTEKDKKIPVEKPKPKIRAAPPVNFEQLLKLAAQKQHEDIVIDVPSKKEPERLLTSKEKKELEEIEAARKSRFKGNGTIPKIPKLGAIPKLSDKNNNNSNGAQKMPSIDRKSDVKRPETFDRSKQLPQTSKYPPQQSSGSKLRDALVKPEKAQSSPTSSKNSHQQKPQMSSSNVKQKESFAKPSTSSKMSPPMKSGSGMAKPRPVVKEAVRAPPKEPQRPRDFPPKDLMRSREFPPKDLLRTREFPPKDLKRPRDFPPRDMKRPAGHQQMAKKRRVIEDEDSEYDSELDDFIDDSEENFNYSNEIQKIFGYDKSRFRDEDYDDREMESDYRTVMKEEYISKKIGLMEDLEDMKMEAEEKRQKELGKKKRKKV